MVFNAARRFFHTLLDMIYPPACPLCGARVPAVDAPCGACASRIIELDSDALLNLPWAVRLGRVLSCFAHEEPVKSALWSLKYEGRPQALKFFCGSLARHARSMGGHDAVTSVPMPARRVVLRGIDAAGILAYGLASRLGLRHERGLIGRGGRAARQVGLSRDERIKNARNSFVAQEGVSRRVKGKRILLIDDVMTTGATINECARALIKAGAVRVDALTVARAL